MVYLIRSILIISGIELLVMNILYIGRRKIDTGNGVMWTVYALIGIAMGFLLDIPLLIRLIRLRNMLLLVILSEVVTMTFYAASIKIEELHRRNAELEIKFALLDEERREEKEAPADLRNTFVRPAPEDAASMGREL